LTSCADKDETTAAAKTLKKKQKYTTPFYDHNIRVYLKIDRYPAALVAFGHRRGIEQQAVHSPQRITAGREKNASSWKPVHSDRSATGKKMHCSRRGRSITQLFQPESSLLENGLLSAMITFLFIFTVKWRAVRHLRLS